MVSPFHTPANPDLPLHTLFPLRLGPHPSRLCVLHTPFIYFGCTESLPCGLFSSCEWRLLARCYHGLLVAVASLVVEVLEQLWHMESVIVPHGPICLTACGIFLDQGSNPGLILHWQVASSPLGHEGSPVVLLSII